MKRLRLWPLPTWALLTAVVLSSMIIAAVELVILLAVGKVVFDVHLPGNLAAFTLAVAVGMVSSARSGWR